MSNRDLIPWGRGALSPIGLDSFAAFRREMDRMFDDFIAPATKGGPAAATSTASALLRPTIDVEETGTAYTVTAELLGLTEKEVELTLRDNALLISGEKRSERKEEKGGRYYAERTFGRFERTIPFGTEVNADHVDASFKNGVLTVTLAKDEKAQDKTRRIEIRAASEGAAATASAAGGANH